MIFTHAIYRDAVVYFNHRDIESREATPAAVGAVAAGISIAAVAAAVRISWPQESSVVIRE